MKALFLLVLMCSAPLFAQLGVSVHGKQHAGRDNFDERPYGEDDMSYGLFIEAFEGVGGWKLGAMYSDDATGFEGVESVITPELSLMVVDRIWETAISVLIDYVDANGETDWGDVYFQTEFGLNVPLGDRVQIGIHAYYPMESISDITDIGFNDMDYGATLRVMF